MLESVTIQELQTQRPDLVAEITKGIKESIQKDGDFQAKEVQLKESLAKIAEYEKADKISKQTTLIEVSLKDSKLPDITKDRIKADLKETLFETEDKIKEALAEKVKSELEYLNKISPKGKINLGTGSEGADLKESFATALSKRMGIKEEKKEEK